MSEGLIGKIVRFENGEEWLIIEDAPTPQYMILKNGDETIMRATALLTAHLAIQGK